MVEQDFEEYEKFDVPGLEKKRTTQMEKRDRGRGRWKVGALSTPRYREELADNVSR
jgi:hypothetical protein